MSRISSKKIVITAAVLLAVFGTLTVVNWFIYPFSSAQPNYADVEAVFNKLDIPEGWVVLEARENKGIAGRQCPIEPNTVCFSKEKTFKVPSNTTETSIITIFESSGCISPVIGEKREYTSGKYSQDYICSTQGVIISGTLRIDDEVKMSLRTRSM